MGHFALSFHGCGVVLLSGSDTEVTSNLEGMAMSHGFDVQTTALLEICLLVTLECCETLRALRGGTVCQHFRKK